jgi:hypothetical protein
MYSRLVAPKFRGKFRLADQSEAIGWQASGIYCVAFRPTSTIMKLPGFGFGCISRSVASRSIDAKSPSRKVGAPEPVGEGYTLSECCRSLSFSISKAQIMD